jgi:serine/threonine protein kinase
VSPNIVQYKASWTENINHDEHINGEKNDGKSESSETNVSPLIGHILYIQMELCGIHIGGREIRTLKDAISIINDELNHKFGVPITNIGAFIASHFTEEIVSGLHYLHSSSPPIIHRDLKPENIFITDGRGGIYIKIGDLGLATFHGKSDHPVASQFVALEHTCGRGTHGYMAPEVRHSSLYTEKCDGYSLGCIMMDLFCIDKQK